MTLRASLANIAVKTNKHGRSAALRGREWGGGPYEIRVGGHVPVSVKTIPTWATDWQDVYRALRAVVGAFEFDDGAETTNEAYDEVKRLWQDAQARVRRGIQVKDLTLLKPPSPPQVPIAWIAEAADARGNVTRRRGLIPAMLGLELVIIDTLNRHERYEVYVIAGDDRPCCDRPYGDRPYLRATGFRFKTLAELQAYLRDAIAINRRDLSVLVEAP